MQSLAYPHVAIAFNHDYLVVAILWTFGIIACHHSHDPLVNFLKSSSQFHLMQKN
jgi:hypothetical protein